MYIQARLFPVWNIQAYFMLEHKVNMGIQAHVFGPNFSWTKFFNYIFFYPVYLADQEKVVNPSNLVASRIMGWQ